MTLTQIQSDFSQQLVNPQGSAATQQFTSQLTGPFSAENLLQLYRNNFYISLSEYLEACFPTLVALVGEEFFQQLGKQFIKDHPLSEGSLEQYGAALADYIQNCPQTQELPYLVDICQLEWLLEQAKSYIPYTTFPFAELSQLSEPDQARVCLKLAPKVSIIQSVFPVFSIWQGVQRRELDDIDMAKEESVLIIPSQELEGAEVMLLSAEQTNILLALQTNQPIASLEIDSEIQQQLNLWITRGVISDFNLESQP